MVSTAWEYAAGSVAEVTVFGADSTTEVLLLSDVIVERMLTRGVVQAERIAIFDHNASNTTKLIDLVRRSMSMKLLEYVTYS